ncbi:hypothetical protein, partial [Phenylobacterium sp.]|uniref:hypothetical protein n=1 Tax=Phenylobacterium sp. TaxID=1871053 RepID=UPI002E327FB7
AARGRYEAALSTLRGAYAALGETPPSPRVRLETNMLVVHVAGRLQDVPLTLTSARLSIRQLEAGEGRYTEPERTYLVYWCQTALRYCAQISPIDRRGIAEETPLVFDDLDLRAVSSRLRRSFPVYTPADSEFFR